MKAKEVEFKYNAENLTLSDFTEFCAKHKPSFKFIMASGWDDFYENIKDPTAFCRHRHGPDANQLTFKRKLADSNNFIRTEHNMDMTDKMRPDQVSALCSEFGYKYNTTLFKNCFIYKFDWYTLVYYICYDKDMKELGRFFEIEMAEEHDWKDEQEAWNELVVLEKLAKPLGVSPQSRVKRSLWEMYKK